VKSVLGEFGSGVSMS